MPILFIYAGDTWLARVALACAALALALVAAGFALWIWRWSRRPRRGGAFARAVRSPFAALSLAVAAYAAVWAVAAPRLDRAWLRLQENVKRTYPEYRALTFASAFLPPRGGDGRWAFAHLATRDFGFGRGREESAADADGHALATYRDEDYGEVVTLDGRPLLAGRRYVETRAQCALVGLFENPGAKTVAVVGAEARAYRGPLLKAGLAEAADGKADVVVLAPEPNWTWGAGEELTRLVAEARARLAKGGVAALHLDARLLSAGRAKAVLEEFGAAFPYFRVWCFGRKDWMVTGFAGERSLLMAEDLLELFGRPEAFEAFLEAGVRTATDMMASYAGTAAEVMPALRGIRALDAREGRRTSLRLAFDPPPVGEFSPLQPGHLIPLEGTDPDWFVPGAADPDVYESLLGWIAKVQGARRTLLKAFAKADEGDRDLALDGWARAAAVNPRDPMLRALLDSLDLEARRRLRVGDVNGALRCYENRITVLPKDVAAIHNFGVCLKQAGQMDLATQAFAKAVTEDPDTDAHREELAFCAMVGGHPEVAVVQYEHLRKKYPDRPEYAAKTAKALADPKNPHRNQDIAVALAEQAVEATNWRNRFCLEVLAEVYINSDRLLKGMAVKKRLMEL